MLTPDWSKPLTGYVPLPFWIIFNPNSIDIRAGSTYDIDDLKKRLRVLPVFHKFLDFFIRMLVEDKFVSVNGNRQLEFLERVKSVKDLHGLAKEVGEKYPQFEGTIRLVLFCQSQYSRALSGDIDSNEVLFPGGNNIRANDDYRNPVEYTRVGVYFELIRQYMLRLLKNTRRRKPFRILEIGAGRGGLTKNLIPHLKGRDVEYHFTDLGNFFVTNARKEAAREGYDFMKFGVLDASMDPTQQGYDSSGFDLILAYGVVHMVRSTEKTLGYVKQLLVPGGSFCMMEHSGSKRWDDMINGLAKGWWYFEDTHIRKYSPLLSLNQWGELLEHQGFRDVSVFPGDIKRQAATDCGLIIARRSEAGELQPGIQVKPEAISPVGHLQKNAAGVQVVDANIADPEEMRQSIAAIEERHGKICGVVHCADAIHNNGSPQESRLETADRVLTAELKRSQVFSGVFKDMPLDFLIYCSAYDPISPAADRTGQHAVNLYLNSLAHYQSEVEGRCVVSITQDSEGPVNIGSVLGTVLEQSFPQGGALHQGPGEPRGAAPGPPPRGQSAARDGSVSATQTPTAPIGESIPGPRQ